MMDLAASTDELIEKSTALAKEHGYLHDGELAVVTAGVPVGVSGTTNMIKIHMIGNCLATGVASAPRALLWPTPPARPASAAPSRRSVQSSSPAWFWSSPPPPTRC